MDKNYDDLIVSFLRAKINPYLIMLFGSIKSESSLTFPNKI